MNKVKILLLLCNLIVGFIIYLNLSEETNKPTDFSLKLLDILDGLDEVSISEGKDKKIYLNKKKDEWIITHPIKWNAESLVISNLKTRLAHSSPQLVITREDLLRRGELLSDYGIDINSSRIKIKGNGSQTTIVLGDETRDAQGMFVQIEEYESFRGAIWKASKDLISIASASPVFWGKSTFFTTPMYGIDQLDITIRDLNHSSPETIQLKKKDQSWNFTKPEAGIADSNAINLAINELISSRVAGFVIDQNNSKFITGKPNITIEIKGMGGTESLSVYKNDAENELLCLNQTNNTYFKVSDDLKEKVSGWHSKYRENRIFLHPKRSIKTITIDNNNGRLSLLKKQENEWEVKDHNFTNELFYRGETEKIHQLVDLLYSARITDFTDKKYEDNSERDSVSSFSIIYSDGQKTNVRLLESTPGASYSVAQINDSNHSIVINLGINGIFDQKKYAFKNKLIKIKSFNNVLLKFPEHNASSINIEDNASLSLLNQSLYAKDFLPSSFGSLGLWHQGDWNPWDCSFVFKDENNHTVEKLFISIDKGNGQWFGGLESESTIFTLGNGLIEWVSQFLPTPSNQ